MSRVRLAAILGVALVIVLSAWALTAIAVRRPPMDLGPPIVVSTFTLASATPPVVPSSPEESSPPASGPPASAPPVTTASPTSTRPAEAVPVSKPPVPQAGDDKDDVLDDDDDPFDDDTDDGVPEEDDD